jgi:ABC-type sugar transport system substrate-binding protein
MTYTPHRNRHGLKALSVACLGTLTLVLAACSSSGGSSSASASAPASSASAASTGASATAESTDAAAGIAQYSSMVSSYAAQQAVPGVSALKGKTVWYIPIGESVPILAAFGSAMQSALSQVGIKMMTCDGKFLPTNAAACISQAISQGADGVVTGYIDYASMPTSFNSLVSHHIPVLIAGEAPDGGKTSSPQLAFFNTQPTINLMQKLDMDAVIADSDGKANILYLGVTDSPQTLAGATYGAAYLKSQCPGCTLTQVDYNTASIAKVPSQVSAGLIAHPSTTYVVDELDAAAQPSVAGIEAAGYEHKVKLASTDGDLDSLQRISSSDVQFVDIGTSPVYEGWQFADGILEMLTGKTPSFTLGVVRVFNSSTVKGLALTPAAYSTNAWYGSESFQQTFLTAWGAK